MTAWVLVAGLFNPYSAAFSMKCIISLIDKQVDSLAFQAIDYPNNKHKYPISHRHLHQPLLYLFSKDLHGLKRQPDAGNVFKCHIYLC